MKRRPWQYKKRKVYYNESGYKIPRYDSQPIDNEYQFYRGFASGSPYNPKSIVFNVPENMKALRKNAVQEIVKDVLVKKRIVETDEPERRLPATRYVGTKYISPFSKGELSREGFKVSRAGVMKDILKYNIEPRIINKDLDEFKEQVRRGEREVVEITKDFGKSRVSKAEQQRLMKEVARDKELVDALDVNEYNRMIRPADMVTLAEASQGRQAAINGIIGNVIKIDDMIARTPGMEQYHGGVRKYIAKINNTLSKKYSLNKIGKAQRLHDLKKAVGGLNYALSIMKSGIHKYRSNDSLNVLPELGYKNIYQYMDDVEVMGETFYKNIEMEERDPVEYNNYLVNTINRNDHILGAIQRRFRPFTRLYGKTQFNTDLNRFTTKIGLRPFGLSNKKDVFNRINRNDKGVNSLSTEIDDLERSLNAFKKYGNNSYYLNVLNKLRNLYVKLDNYKSYSKDFDFSNDIKVIDDKIKSINNTAYRKFSNSFINRPSDLYNQHLYGLVDVQVTLKELREHFNTDFQRGDNGFVLVGEERNVSNDHSLYFTEGFERAENILFNNNIDFDKFHRVYYRYLSPEDNESFVMLSALFRNLTTVDKRSAQHEALSNDILNGLVKLNDIYNRVKGEYERSLNADYDEPHKIQEYLIDPSKVITPEIKEEEVSEVNNEIVNIKEEEKDDVLENVDIRQEENENVVENVDAPVNEVDIRSKSGVQQYLTDALSKPRLSKSERRKAFGVKKLITKSNPEVNRQLQERALAENGYYIESLPVSDNEGEEMSVPPVVMEDAEREFVEDDSPKLSMNPQVKKERKKLSHEKRGRRFVLNDQPSLPPYVRNKKTGEPIDMFTLHNFMDNFNDFNFFKGKFAPVEDHFIAKRPPPPDFVEVDIGKDFDFDSPYFDHPKNPRLPLPLWDKKKLKLIKKTSDIDGIRDNNVNYHLSNLFQRPGRARTIRRVTENELYRGVNTNNPFRDAPVNNIIDQAGDRRRNEQGIPTYDETQEISRLNENWDGTTPNTNIPIYDETQERSRLNENWDGTTPNTNSISTKRKKKKENLDGAIPDNSTSK